MTMIRFKRWWDAIRQTISPFGTASVVGPAPVKKEWDLAEARERDAQSPWKKPWSGRGIAVGGFANEKTGVLHNHPRSRPQTMAKCDVCGYPQFGWGAYDHWPDCGKRLEAEMWMGTPKDFHDRMQ